MSEVSIAEARNRLPRLVRRAEAGETVRITRRGRSVAVLLSEREYDRLRSPRLAFFEFLQDWRAQMVARGIDFPRGGEWKNLRDNAPGREVAWD